MEDLKKEFKGKFLELQKIIDSYGLIPHIQYDKFLTGKKRRGYAPLNKFYILAPIRSVAFFYFSINLQYLKF